MPSYFVHSHIMSINSINEMAGVGFRAYVHFSLLSTNKEKVIFLFMKVKGSATA